jgi:hypothetical protein
LIFAAGNTSFFSFTAFAVKDFASFDAVANCAAAVDAAFNVSVLGKTAFDK